MNLTKEQFIQGKSSRGGWNAKQISLFGEDMSKKGWKKRVLRKDVTQEVIDKFLALKNAHLKGKQRTRKRRLKPTKTVLNNKYIEDSDQYNHPNWRALRARILERDEFTCKICGTEKEILHVHHVKYLGDFVWDTPPRFLVTLCKFCHKRIHKRR